MVVRSERLARFRRSVRKTTNGSWEGGFRVPPLEVPSVTAQSPASASHAGSTRRSACVSGLNTEPNRYSGAYFFFSSPGSPVVKGGGGMLRARLQSLNAGYCTFGPVHMDCKRERTWAEEALMADESCARWEHEGRLTWVLSAWEFSSERVDLVRGTPCRGSRRRGLGGVLIRPSPGTARGSNGSEENGGDSRAVRYAQGIIGIVRFIRPLHLGETGFDKCWRLRTGSGCGSAVYHDGNATNEWGSRGTGRRCACQWRARVRQSCVTC